MGDHLGIPGAIGITMSGGIYAPFPYSVLSLVMDSEKSCDGDLDDTPSSNTHDNGTNSAGSHNDCGQNLNTSKRDSNILSEEDTALNEYSSSERGSSPERDLFDEETSESSERKYKIYRCGYGQCNAVFTRPGQRREHLNVHEGKRPYKCGEENCAKSYGTWNHLRRHLIDVHQNNVDKRSYMGLTIRTKGGKPVKSHVCPYNGCGAEFVRPWRLAAHICKHTGEKPYKCSVNDCDKAYTMAGHLQRHVQESHEPHLPIIKQYICVEEGCKKVYRSMESVRRHHRQNHIEDAVKTHPHKCSYCGRRFATLNRLVGHEYSHNSVIPYKCKDCNLTFTEISLWKKHNLRAHLKPLTCPSAGCQEVFHNASLLKQHKKTSHILNFPCSSCGRELKSKSALRVHMQTHLKLHERNLFMCPYSDCPRFYTKKCNLEQHIRVGHEGRKLPCPHPGCEKRLVTKQKLQEHLKLHDPHRRAPERKFTVRNLRIDSGKPKRSMAVKLAGMEVPYEVEKNLLKDDQQLLEEICNNKSQEEMETSFSDSDSLEDSDDGDNESGSENISLNMSAADKGMMRSDMS